MMRLPLLALLACLLLPLAVQARIGETEKDIEARYGKATEDADPELKRGFAPAEKVMVYEKAGLTITVVFYKGRASIEIFRHASDTRLTEEEISDLLTVNKGQTPESWERVDRGTGEDQDRFWSLPATGRTAKSDKDRRYLRIVAVDFKEAMRTREDHKLLKEGF